MRAASRYWALTASDGGVRSLVLTSHMAVLMTLQGQKTRQILQFSLGGNKGIESSLLHVKTLSSITCG